MPWVKIDDQFFFNHKIVRAGRDARDLYLAGLAFVAGQLTDGFIPEGALGLLAGMACVANPEANAKQLVQQNLWHNVDGGWEIHDYLNYNPTDDKVREKKKQRQIAGKLGGQQSGKAKREAKSKQNAKQNSEQNQTPSPSHDSIHTHARAPGKIDPVEHMLAAKEQGLNSGIAEPGEEQYWQYRDEALKVYEQQAGARLAPASKDAILALVASADFSPERWAKSVKSCVAAGVRTGNVMCMVQTYQEADGDYAALVKHGKGNSRGDSMAHGNEVQPPDWIDQQQADIKSGKIKVKVPDWIGGTDG